MEPRGSFSRSDALHAGISDAQLRRGTGSGRLVKIDRGAYCDAASWGGLNDLERYRERVAATLTRRSDAAVASHWSAAALHGLPLVAPDHRRVHVSIDGSGGGKRTATSHEHRLRLSMDDVEEIDGVTVTTLARTALDIASNVTFDRAVCAIESAMRAGASNFGETLDRVGRRTGIGTARRALDYASPLTESLGESWSRALMCGWDDIPEPRLQHEFRDPLGRFVARTDFDWDGRLVGEFDGMVKYAADGSAAVVKEKHREDALRAMGVHVVRWTWDDLLDGRRLRTLLARGLALASR